MGINIDKETLKLLDEYFKLFPNGELFPEWSETSEEEKQEMLKESIKDKKPLLETKIFNEKYMERITI